MARLSRWAGPTSTKNNFAAGGSVAFSVSASGEGPLTYQWRKDGVAIPGATTSTYAVTGATAAAAGAYDVVVRDSLGSLTTAVGRLTVNVLASISASVSSIMHAE